MMHSSTVSASTPARRMASATTSAPSCGAVKDLSAPRNLPVGVRTALTMTESRTGTLDAIDDIGAEQRLQAPEDGRRRPRHFARPLHRGGFDDERPPLEFDLGSVLAPRSHRDPPAG